MRILALSPHTDDADLGAGGTLAGWVEQGREVWTVAFSTVMRSELEDEFRAAADALGILPGNVIVYNFPQRTFQLSVPAKSYVVIGPGAQARRPSSIGQHFLVRERDGAKFETVLVLVPQLLAAPMPKRPQPIPRRPDRPSTCGWAMFTRLQTSPRRRPR